MNYKLSRRRFGQLAIAGTVASGISYLANKASAQTSSVNINIIGVSSGPIISDETASPEVNTTELDSTAPDNLSTASIPIGLVVQSLNTGRNNLQTLPISGLTKALLETNEAITGFTSLKDGTLVVAITPVSARKKEATPTRITLLSTPIKTLLISGLKKNEQLGSVLGTNDGRLIGLVGKKNGTPPIKLVAIDLQTGEISLIDKFKLPQNERVSNLAECPDGKLYTVLLGTDGDTTLVQLDPERKKPVILAQLKINGEAWNNGLESLLCSATGQLIAFGAMRYTSPNASYIVDRESGNMTRIQNFDATKITLAPT
jgi:hypothetical protein